MRTCTLLAVCSTQCGRSLWLLSASQVSSQLAWYGTPKYQYANSYILWGGSSREQETIALVEAVSSAEGRGRNIPGAFDAVLLPGFGRYPET